MIVNNFVTTEGTKALQVLIMFFRSMVVSIIRISLPQCSSETHGRTLVRIKLLDKAILLLLYIFIRRQEKMPIVMEPDSVQIITACMHY